MPASYPAQHSKVQAAELLEQISEGTWRRHTRGKPAMKQQQSQFAPLQNIEPDDDDLDQHKADYEHIQAKQTENPKEMTNEVEKVQGRKAGII